MFQDASTNSTLLNSSDTVTEAKSETDGFSSDSYADRLMDDLFQDVEQLLHGESLRSQPVDLSSKSISETEASSSEISPSSPLSASIEEPLASSALATLLKSLSVNPPDEQIARIPETATIETSGSVAAPQNRTSGSVYDRLLLAVGCISIVLSLALWLFYQESRRSQVVSSVPATSATTGVVANPVAATQNQFSDYAQKALQSIDQRSQQNMPTTSTTGATTAGVAVPGMLTVTVPNALTSSAIAPSRVATGLERVYVPVYQFPSNFKPPNSVMPLPAGAAPSAVPQSGAPVRKPAAAATSPITPGAPRRLAGVLELGDRSVALFEVNGVTQRYGIGESIGSSGWSLVEVSKEQAMIRRNGEVRSVFVGQKF